VLIAEKVCNKLPAEVKSMQFRMPAYGRKKACNSACSKVVICFQGRLSGKAVGQGCRARLSGKGPCNGAICWKHGEIGQKCSIGAKSPQEEEEEQEQQQSPCCTYVHTNAGKNTKGFLCICYYLLLCFGSNQKYSVDFQTGRPGHANLHKNTSFINVFLKRDFILLLVWYFGLFTQGNLRGCVSTGAKCSAREFQQFF
jgi:hypothetical protein